MKASQGILTVRGGMTSHAAVVARGMGKCCVSGCGDDQHGRSTKKQGIEHQRPHLREGDWISIDGSTGNIYDGKIATVAATEDANFKPLHGLG